MISSEHKQDFFEMGRPTKWPFIFPVGLPMFTANVA